MTWKRLESVIFPQVWTTFHAKDPDTGNVVKYRVQDLPEDRFEEVLRFMETDFIRDSTISKCLDLINEPEFDGRVLWRKTLEQQITIVCFKEGSNEICGFNLLEVLERGAHEDKPKFRSKKLQDLIKVMDYVEDKADPFNRHGVDKFLHAMGLFVPSKYRGLGIATELLKARVPLGKALGLKVTCTVFTGVAAQGTARKAGFTEDYSALYKDLEKQEPFVQFPNISSPEVKYMSLRITD